MFTVWYEDNEFGLTKTTIFKSTKIEALKFFNTYYKRYKLVSIIKQNIII